MTTELLEIQPHELRFTFELKKQSTCSIRLVNKSDHHVAFKVKTTSPKKYCVRPNTGVIEPNSTCEFTVTMQAQRVAPPDLICKDKFLIQSTVVPEGTEEEDITSTTFAKEDGKHIEEKKLKVILVSANQSPASSPINGTLKAVQNNETSESKDDGVHRTRSHTKVTEGMDVARRESIDAEARRSEESIKMKDTEELRLAKDLEDMKLKVKDLETKLREAKVTISNLTDERRSAIQENKLLQGELDLLRSKRRIKARGQEGFPLLFVCMVALISLYFGYMLHS